MRAFLDQINSYTTAACGKHEKKCERLCLYISGGRCSFGSHRLKRRQLSRDWKSRVYTWVSVQGCRTNLRGFTNMAYSLFLFTFFACCHFLLHIYIFVLLLFRVFSPSMMPFWFVAFWFWLHITSDNLFTYTQFDIRFIACFFPLENYKALSRWLIRVIIDQRRGLF